MSLIIITYFYFNQPESPSGGTPIRTTNLLLVDVLKFQIQQKLHVKKAQINSADPDETASDLGLHCLLY